MHCNTCPVKALVQAACPVKALVQDAYLVKALAQAACPVKVLAQVAFPILKGVDVKEGGQEVTNNKCVLPWALG